MPTYSKRLPHVLTPAEVARLLAATYADSHRVDEEEAFERLSRAFGVHLLFEELVVGVSAALNERLGPRTQEDALIDRLSLGLQKRTARSKPLKSAEVTPAVSAALVRIDVELGLAPETLRSTLASDKGQALLREGWRALGAHLVKELLR